MKKNINKISDDIEYFNTHKMKIPTAKDVNRMYFNNMVNLGHKPSYIIGLIQPSRVEQFKTDVEDLVKKPLKPKKKKSFWEKFRDGLRHKTDNLLSSAY